MCYKVKLKYILYIKNNTMHQPPTPTHPIQIGLDPFLKEVYKNLQRIKYSFTSMPTNNCDNKPITPLSTLQL